MAKQKFFWRWNMAKVFEAGLLAAILAVTACSEPPASAVSAEPGEEASSASAQTGNTVQGVIPQAQLDAMAKAAATGSVLEQAEQERRKQMEAQGL
jgi:hypothetical protein